MPAFASKGHLIRSFNKLGDLLLTFGKQNKKPHAEQKATNDYEQAVLEPAYVQKPVNPPKPLQTTSKTPSPVTPLKVNWNTSKPNGLQVRDPRVFRSEEHTSELQSRPHLVCRLLLEKKNIDIRRLGRQPAGILLRQRIGLSGWPVLGGGAAIVAAVALLGVSVVAPLELFNGSPPAVA